MLFSVIIPTYNRASFLAATIDSVLAQEFDDFEIIVVDDESTDHTRDLVSKYTDARVHYHWKKNNERGAARNSGISLAKGEYVTFLDSDDIVYPHHLQKAKKFIDTHEKHNCVFHLGYEIKTVSGEIIQRQDKLSNINKLLASGNPLSCMGVFVRHDVIKKNLFIEDRTLSGLEDWELWLRLSKLHTIEAVNGVSSAIINHPERSVLNPDINLLNKKVNAFIKYVSENEANTKTLYKTLASVKTYAALHLAMGLPTKKESIKYLWQGVRQNPMEIFRKRFFAIIKHLLIN